MHDHFLEIIKQRKLSNCSQTILSLFTLLSYIEINKYCKINLSKNVFFFPWHSQQGEIFIGNHKIFF